MKKKIVIDARLYGLENTGIGRYTMSLLENLSNIESKNEYLVLLRTKYFKSLTFPDNWTKIEAEFKQYSAKEQLKLPKLINSLAPDLVHFLHFNIPLNFNKKFIVTLHDLTMHSSQHRKSSTLPFYKYYLKRIGYKKIFRKAVKDSQEIIVPSSFVKQDLLSNYDIDKDKIKVIYQGIEQRVGSNKIRANVALKYGLNRPYFIYTGSLYPHKNIERGVEAVLHLNKVQGFNILFAIVTSNNDFAKRLDKFIQQNNAGNYIKVLGFVPDAELNILYRLSMGFLYPSLQEGFGLPGLEAMSSGTITLCSDIPVFNEVYEKSAIYFNPHDFTSVSNAMKKVLEFSEKQRQAQIKLGKIQAQKYSWEKTAEETLQVYEEVLNL